MFVCLCLCVYVCVRFIFLCPCLSIWMSLCAVFFNLKFLAAPGLPCCVWAFSSFSDWGLLSICSWRASHCSGFSCSRTPALGHLGFSICGHSLSCPAECGFILGSSWALAGGFLTTGPPGKSCVYSLYFLFCVYSCALQEWLRVSPVCTQRNEIKGFPEWALPGRGLTAYKAAL